MIEYEKIVCVNLEDRKDKYNSFIAGLPQLYAGKIDKYEAIRGSELPRPDWWHGGGGAWGCYLSHRRILEECLSKGIQSVLIFEDDAEFIQDYERKVRVYEEHLPHNAQWVYYGGQHLKQTYQLPERINQYVYRPYNVNRTHAYGLIGTEAIRTVYKHLLRGQWSTPNHIDHWFGKLHESGKMNVYCPSEWLVSQRAGHSDVACRDKGEAHWANASLLSDGSNEPFYAVLGCHSSGSSALAGVLYNLGVHLGNSLVGKYGSAPINGGEAIALRDIFEKNARVPLTGYENVGEVQRRLLKWVNVKRSEAKSKGTVAAGKYPQLAPICPWLAEKLNGRLRIIVSGRPIEESIASLAKRFPKLSIEQITEHQKWIIQGISKTVKVVGYDNVLFVSYEELINNPWEEIIKIKDFMGLDSTPEQAQKATEYINPKLKHF